MAITSINGPATPAPGGYQPAVRNPIYGSGGEIIGSGTPGAWSPPPGSPYNPVGPAIGQAGRARAILQAILMNRANPYENMSMTEDELRRAAMGRLKG